MSRPFVDRPEAVWFYCADCGDMYDGREDHECNSWSDEDPLAGFRGIVFALCTVAILYALLVAAGALRLGWRPW